MEVARGFTEGKCLLYDEDEFQRMVALYGTMTHLQTLGSTRHS
jgi:hypothetical protein